MAVSGPPAHRRQGRADFAAALPWLILPILLLIAAHEIIIALLDLHPWILRLVSILIPLPFAWRRLPTVAGTLWAALLIAAAGVFGMLVTTSLVDHVPVLPQGLREWAETLQYMASIGLAYLVGSLVRWRLDPSRSARPDTDSVTGESPCCWPAVPAMATKAK